MRYLQEWGNDGLVVGERDREGVAETGLEKR